MYSKWRIAWSDGEYWYLASFQPADHDTEKPYGHLPKPLWLKSPERALVNDHDLILDLYSTLREDYGMKNIYMVEVE